MLLKRYWKLLSLIVVIVVILVTYFVHTSLVVASQFPDFELKTMNGDKSVVKDVILSGELYQNDNRYGTSVVISNTGSNYREEQSYFEKMGNSFQPNEVTRLQKEYRNFMRGKQGDFSTYFENDDYLAYINVQSARRIWNTIYHEDYSFVVDVLQKETNDSKGFDIHIPGQEDYFSLYILDVQMINGELKVVTEVGYRDEADQIKYELKVYTIDLTTEKIAGDETLLMGERNEMEESQSWTEINLLNNRENINEQKYLLLEKETKSEGEATRDDENGTEEVAIETTNRTFYIYNLETKELKELELSDEQQKEIATPNLLTWGNITDTNVELAYSSGNNLTISSYGLEDLNEETKHTFHFGEKGLKELGAAKMKDGKVYVVGKDQDDSPIVLVGDYKTGEIVYEGEVVLKDTEDDSKNYDLQLYNLVFN